MAEKKKNAEGTRADQPQKKKKGKKKFIFIPLLLIIIIFAGIGGTWYLGIIELPRNPVTDKLTLLLSSTDDSMEYVSDADSFSETASVEISIDDIEVPPIKIEKEPITAPAPKPQYYVKVNSCIYDECIENVTSELERYRFKHTQRKSKRSTVYFEVSSSSIFTKLRAEDKVRIINKYNELMGFPYLIRYGNDKYKILFGQFPQKETANRMKTHLDQLYPQIKMEFEVVPKKSAYDITTIFAGPFSREAAKNSMNELKDNPAFDDVQIASNI